MKPRILLSLYGGKENYIAALERCGAEAHAFYLPELSTDYDGLLLCGGSDIHPKYYGEEINGSVDIDHQRDEAEFLLLDAFVKAGKPVFGICRGLQLINAYCGGTLIQHLPQTAEHRSGQSGVDLIHPAVTVEGSLLRQLLGGEAQVNSYHHQAIGAPGQGLKATMMTGSVIEAAEHESLPLFGVQWHPERTTGAFASAEMVDGIVLFEHFVKLCK
ncbi:MAG: gamma-glutamyl-gamma-aminobutyrate hydrolase family protein [Clostridia bacterium]|nr:gamma-glutamyl-gamma-aminobutyrate hydrolase family protein [Clostridia bacterium]